MQDAGILLAIGLGAVLASYISRWLGLLIIVAVVLATIPIWALAGGSPLVLILIIPAIVGFVVGRFAKTKVESA